MSMLRRSLPLALAGLVLVVAGCGSKSKSSASTSTSTPAPAAKSTPAAPPATAGGASTVKLSADPSKLAFDKTALSAKAGKVTMDMSNPSGIPHAIAVEGNGVDKSGQTVMQGGTSTVTVDLKPGKYQFYCPVDGHRAAGMQGTLTVT